MKSLSEDLHALAEQAPDVDLGARAVRGARRRRATRLAVAAAAAVCVIAGGGATFLWQERAPALVLPPPETTVLPLPAKGVAPVEQFYRAICRDTGPTCAWRLVTRDGATYELADGPRDGPVEATPDGRRIAYYSPGRHAVVVRDLAGGQVWTSPLKQQEREFDSEFALRLAPGGLRFAVSGRTSNKLVDLKRGTATDLPKGWWPVSVSDGTGPVVMAKSSDDTTSVRVLGHDPVAVTPSTYDFSALAPDGRTMARVNATLDRDRTPMVQKDGTLVVFDVLGGVERRIRPSGLAAGLLPAKLGGWLSAREVTMMTVSGDARQDAVVYAVDVVSSRARELFTLRDDRQFSVPGLVR
ncbi:hypothetical protein DMB42_47645 [Nonomuraea sp. WAC 01424]|uniref:hypothetical protein n=1 Tax=Nonomuraea sp. WAC 01424 TaxID=2203200 RepID=UPI000F76E92D|nr:hypothetical protein [Nonomuraea sp. WAC 01424]RSM96553.1 hypothetical protein DMB42_47645 [Nonomuraea sp. WAC 01424]